jgi:DNA helicase-2/ATP-dependent DNA helicase PcrA
VQLNPEQELAVNYGDGPLMVLAGAGSGKTRVLVQRIATLVGRGTHPSRILAVTFTNKAAGEMRARLEEMLGYHARAMWIGTFHATCARLLRVFHEQVGLTADYSIFDDDDQMRLVSSLLKERRMKDEATPRSVLSAIGNAKTKGEDPVEYNRLSYLSEIVSVIYPMYQAALAREDAVDFSDLLLKVRELFKHKEVAPQLRARFDHVLVDEFQDTNLVQYDLVRGFSGATRNLTVVGDDDQSIYSWRGAEPRNLLDFKRDYADAKEIKLEQNYRSTSVILDAANAVIANNVDRHTKKLWTDREGGDPILWEEVADDRSEANFVAAAIEGLVAEEGREWGDIAILYRTHAQSRVLEEMLLSRRIDYKIVGGVSFFQRKEVKDIRAYLRLVANSAADTCFERVVNVPTRGIGKTTVERLRHYARGVDKSLLDAAIDASRGMVPEIKAAPSKKLGRFVEIIAGLRNVQKAGASVSELIIQVVERSGYRERLELEGTPDATDRLNNLAELVAMASDFDDETDGEGTLVDFEERISLASTADSQDGRGTSVTMMTVHAAKGLEFPIVFAVGMEDGLFPSVRENQGFHDPEERKDLEEERRLAYVAFTRAMDRLVLTSARVRRKWAEIKMTRPSRFIDEIPEHCLAVRMQKVDPTPPSTFRKGPARQAPSYDEYDQSVQYEEFPEYSADNEMDFDQSAEFVAIAAGATVRHTAFGTGRVVSSKGSGKDQKLVIDFPTVGLKTVMSGFVEPVFF